MRSDIDINESDEMQSHSDEVVERECSLSNNSVNDQMTHDQMLRYAEDLVRTYRDSQKYKKELEETNKKLKRYAEDLNTLRIEEKKISNTLEETNTQLHKYAKDLSRLVRSLKDKNRELNDAFLDTIFRLVMAAEYKDEDTGDHIIRMSRYSVLIAEKYGMTGDDLTNILYAAPMHDIGKIGIPDRILLKNGTLTDDEMSIMKTHTTIGAKLLDHSHSITLKIAQEIALTHHEKWDGSGYPKGLAREMIPVSGRIVAIADVFDALTSKRPYKEPFSIEKSLGIITSNRGRHFDPDLVDILTENIDEILEIKSSVFLGENLKDKNL
ncbi:HD domain-containing protein [bacterium]|nr:HD domain-containing protein [bacterium]